MPKGVPGSGPGAGAGGGGGGVDWLNPVMEALKAITEALTYPGADLGQLAHMQAMLQQIAISARQGGQPGGQPDVMGPGAPPGPPPGMGGAPGPPGGMPGAGMAVPPGGGAPGAGGDMGALLAALGGAGGAGAPGVAPPPGLQVPGGDELARVMGGGQGMR